jgi:radical SAM protein with 4Fe4S-binding SPASM domain
VNQFALGGRGAPDQHEHFEELLIACCENELVPNFTTSGFGFTPEVARLCKAYCGAVAVSWYRNDYTLRAIEMLLEAGVKTNIHYVLGKNSIDEAITRLEHDDFPQGINGVVFLLHKPVGLGAKENVLSPHDPRVAEFFRQVDRGNREFKVGMDSCTMPGVVNFCKNVIPEAIDTCEGARFSCYIGPDMIMTPCSFDQENRYGVSLREHSIEEAWNSETFDRFRSVLQNRCPDCERRENCMGGCPLCPEIVLCQAVND